MTRSIPAAAILLFLLAQGSRANVPIVENGKPVAQIVVDARGAVGAGPGVLADAGRWLADAISEATGAQVPVVEELPEGPALIIARSDAWPDVAAAADLKSDSFDAYCIVTKPDRVYILGATESAARHGVADVLRRWGFRYFAPSPNWRYAPRLKNISVDLNIAAAPALADRRIWYAYGMGEEDIKPLLQDYTRWAVANRLSVGSVIQTGHSYGHIIGRNKEEFAAHPEYYALLPDGKRDSERAVAARKFCVSNPGLIELVTRDRLQLLEDNRRLNPAAFMVSVDPSDGEGTCHCENCAKLGTTTDRVFHLANAVARGLRKKHADAWVGLYAYSSHRLPPTIEVEPNVYVQVAMGFNHTQYSLPELVGRWSSKVGAIGLREYYGVEAWDWGLPGRMRGGRTSYHAKWIPYYAERKLNAVNAETNANWGGQTLGLYVAAQLMWNPTADVDSLVEEFFALAFEDAAAPMRTFYALLDESPPLRSSTLLPLFETLNEAYEATDSQAVRKRLVDLMAYMVYVARFREFDLVRSRRSERDDEYYRALLPLMEYAWRIRHRDMVHYYALARRLCNGLPVQDKRLDFYLANKDRTPIFKTGKPPTDLEVQGLFHETVALLKADGDPTVSYSRFFERVPVPGEDAGPSGILANEDKAVARFRRGLRGYLVPGGKQDVRLGVAPAKRPVTVTVYIRGDDVLLQKEIHAAGEGENAFQEVTVELPKANEYRFEISGDFTLRVPNETPLVFEASIGRPAWIDYSGPHYFYVPRGTKELIVNASPRLSLIVPGRKQRLDVSPADREQGKEYIVIEVPANADGRLWHTTNMTRGQVSLLNVPPLMSFHPSPVLVPRETAEADDLTTKE